MFSLSSFRIHMYPVGPIFNSVAIPF